MSTNNVKTPNIKIYMFFYLIRLVFDQRRVKGEFCSVEGNVGSVQGVMNSPPLQDYDRLQGGG